MAHAHSMVHAHHMQVCHAVWGGGLLSHHLDFAGGTVIHLLSGVSAATAATFLSNLAKGVNAADAKKARANVSDRRPNCLIAQVPTRMLT